MSKPILQAITDNRLGNIRLIATDMDGTLTEHGQFTSELIQTLEKLNRANIAVLIVTGRSAGWVQAISTYLPIVGAIAENGGLLYWNHATRRKLLTGIPNINQHRHQLKSVFQLLQSKFPQLAVSEDNRFRVTDWTFELQELTRQELEEINNICQAEGWGFTYSTVQCHLKPVKQDKAIALEQIIQQYFPNLIPEQIVTVGDSPNDESLFDQTKFPLSVGVANILEYRDRLKHFPAYVTRNPESEGFCELAELIVNTNTTDNDTP